VAAFETTDTAVMSGAQLDALVGVTPMVLDLDGNGVSTSSLADGVKFDINATGHSSQVGWVGGNDGLLVLDRNHDGKINDGSELFGAAMLNADGQRSGNGYAALSQFDTNHDGAVSAADAGFNDLQVWVDGNHNGVTEGGELKSLADLGIVSMDLNAHSSTATDNGNLLGLVSSYTTASGDTKGMADVWFAKDGGGDASTPVELTISDVLVDPGQSAALDAVSSGAESKTASASTADAGSSNHVVVDPTKGLIDDQQNSTPLI
jgi:hypothetical protein